MKKIVLSWMVCVLGAVALFAWLGHSFIPAGQADTPSALIRGDFALTDASGKTITEQDFHGRYMLVYFGYTHCPDICPTSLLLMQNALSHVGALAQKVQPIFITVDPARDTPKVTGEYASHFGKQVLGLSGTDAQIQSAADHYKVYYSKVVDKGSALGYMVDHSGFIYLMGPDAHYLTHFAANASEHELEEGLKKYVH